MCGITQEQPDLRRSHSLGDEAQTVESVVISELIGAADLILEGKDRVLGVEYGQGSHEGTSSPSHTCTHL